MNEIKQIENFTRLNHITFIKEYLISSEKSSEFHLVIVDGKPGWGKSTTVKRALRQANISFHRLGAYSTPIQLYNFLYEHKDEVVFIDDSSGLFDDKIAMAILKEATYTCDEDPRIIKWNSNTAFLDIPEFEFNGKIIIICNSFPDSIDGDAIRSRGYYYNLHLSIDDAKNLILEASKNTKKFPNQKFAHKAAEFINSIINETNFNEISYRVLNKTYDFIKRHPNDQNIWKQLILELLTRKPLTPEELIKKLNLSNLSVKEQEIIFEKKTGLKRRSFFKYKQKISQIER